jgi:hypothetical protein
VVAPPGQQIDPSESSADAKAQVPFMQSVDSWQVMKSDNLSSLQYPTIQSPLAHMMSMPLQNVSIGMFEQTYLEE